MKKIFLAAILMLIGIAGINAQSILIEAESLTNKGEWVADPKFVEQMGSPYHLAHGMGKPEKDASTTFSIRKPGPIMCGCAPKLGSRNAYIINRSPLPFINQEVNKSFIARLPELNDYSKSVFISRIAGESDLLPYLLPLKTSQTEHLDNKHRDLILASWRKYRLTGYSELIDQLKRK